MATGFEGTTTALLFEHNPDQLKDSKKLTGAERDAHQAMEKILQKDQVTASKLGAILDKILTIKEELGKADDEKKDKAAKVRCK